MRIIEEELQKHGKYVCKTEGTSMMPMLKQGRDRVIIVKPTFPLKKYDVPVYRRGDHYTMHRIIKIKKDGSYVICGDNRVNFEYDITEEKVIGVLAAYMRGDEYVELTDKDYLRYLKKLGRRYPIRYIKNFLFRVKRKLGM